MNNSLDLIAAADKSTRAISVLAAWRCDDQTVRSTLDVLSNGTYDAVFSGYVVEIIIPGNTHARQVGNLQVATEQGIRGMQKGTVTLSDAGVVFQGE